MNDALEAWCRRAFEAMRRDWPTSTTAVLVEVHDSDEEERWDLVAYPVASDGRQVGWGVEWVAERLQLPPGDRRARAEFVGRCAASDDYPLPVLVSPHDSTQAYDSTSGRWIDDVELWGVRRFSGPPHA